MANTSHAYSKLLTSSCSKDNKLVNTWFRIRNCT